LNSSRPIEALNSNFGSGVSPGLLPGQDLKERRMLPLDKFMLLKVKMLSQKLKSSYPCQNNFSIFAFNITDKIMPFTLIFKGLSSVFQGFNFE